MSKYSLSIFFACLLVFLPSLTIEARGGRGGGRGGGGRGAAAGAARRAGGARPVQRSPSLSRATPNRAHVNRAASRPAISQAQRSAVRQQVGVGNRPQLGSGNRPQLSAPVNRQNLQSQFKAQQGTRRVDTNSALGQQFRTNRSQQQQLNRQNANQIRDQFRQNRPGYNNWFSPNFFDRQGFRPRYYDARADWWQAARWSNVNSWLGAAWAAPIYYDSVNNLYYEDTPVSGAQMTYDQGSSSPVSVNQPQTDWMPLGVFALTPRPEQYAQATMFLQLALNRNGEISGTYYNSSTNAIYEVVGTVDKSTQQVIVRISNHETPILITALNNLTDYQTLVRLHFANGVEQAWTLTQIQK